VIHTAVCIYKSTLIMKNNQDTNWKEWSLLGSFLAVVGWLLSRVFGKNRVEYILSYAGMAKLVLYSVGFIAVGVMVWINYPTLLGIFTKLSKDWIKTEYGIYQALLVDGFAWFILFILISGVVVFDRMMWVRVNGNWWAKIVFVACGLVFNIVNEGLSWYSYSEKSAKDYENQVASDTTSKFQKYELKEVKNNAVIQGLDDLLTDLYADTLDVKNDLKESKADLKLWESRVNATDWKDSQDYVSLQVMKFEDAVTENKVDWQNLKADILKAKNDKIKASKGIEVHNDKVAKDYFADVDFWRLAGGLKGIGLGLILLSVSFALHKIEGTKYTMNFQLTEKAINADGMGGGRKKRTKKLPSKSTVKPTVSTDKSNELGRNIAGMGVGFLNQTKSFFGGIKNRTTELLSSSNDEKSENGIDSESDSLESGSDKPTEKPTEKPTLFDEFKGDEPTENLEKPTDIFKNPTVEHKVRLELIAKWSEHKFGKYVPDLLDIIEGHVAMSAYSFAVKMARKDGIKEGFSEDSLKSFAKRLKDDYEGLIKKS